MTYTEFRKFEEILQRLTQEQKAQILQEVMSRADLVKQEPLPSAE